MMPARPNAPVRVVLDACVLMSGIIRPMLLRLAHAGCFQPVWSTRIGSEWRRNAARIWDVDPALLDEEWHRLQFAFPQADQGDTSQWEAGLRYSDRKDWHVIATGRSALAAARQEAIADEATTIGQVAAGDVRSVAVQVLTWNLKDFNRSELKRLGLGVLDPDRLLASWWHSHRDALQRALRQAPGDARVLGRSESLDEILKRERLFRLRGLLGLR